MAVARATSEQAHKEKLNYKYRLATKLPISILNLSAIPSNLFWSHFLWPVLAELSWVGVSHANVVNVMTTAGSQLVNICS